MDDLSQDVTEDVSVQVVGDYKKGVWLCPQCLRAGGTGLYSVDVAEPSDQDLFRIAKKNLNLHLKRCPVSTMKLKEVRSLVRTILQEEGDTGMPGYGADIGTMPLTAGYGFMNYGGSLKKVFIDPFTDVFQTAKGVGTEMATRAKAAAKVVVESILSSFLPLYETNYAQIFKQMDKSLQEVRKKYEKVYQANDEAFQDKDARFLAFLFDPSAWITAKTVANSPAIARSMLEVFTDGSAGIMDHVLETIRYLKELEMEVRNVSRYNRHVPSRLRKAAHAHRHDLPWEGHERGSEPILEAGEAAQGQAPEQTVSQKLQQLLSNPQLKKELAESPLAQQMRADAQKIMSGLTTQLSQDIANVQKIGSLDDIVRMSQGRVKLPNEGQLAPEEKQQVEAVAVQNVKSAMSEFYRRSLQGAIKHVQQDGVPPDNAYIRTLQGLLSKVGK